MDQKCISSQHKLRGSLKVLSYNIETNDFFPWPNLFRLDLPVAGADLIEFRLDKVCSEF